jgi:hypothetical protein
MGRSCRKVAKRHFRGRGLGLIGTAVVLVIVAALILITLPVGGLILLGLGGYIGVLAHRAHAVAAALR